MMKIISKKRIIALMCVCCLMVSSCFTGVLSGASVSANASAVPTPSNPTLLTLCDVDMAATATIGVTDKTYAPGFDNTVFSFYMSCDSSSGRIYFAGNGNYSGFCIVYNSDGTVSLQDKYATTEANSLGYDTVNITPATVGIESFLTDEVLYQFETHYLDLDNGGEKNDVRLILSINEVKVATVEVNNRLDRIGNHFYTSGGTRRFRGHTATEHAQRDSYETWTFSDVGISDGGPQVSMTGSIPGPLDGSMFVGKMYFPTSSFGNFYIGTGDWYGIEIEASGSDCLKLQVINGASNLATLDPNVAGVALRGNDDLTLGISVKYFDLNTSAGTAKLKIGVWINGELYNGKYFTTGDVNISYLARRIHTYGMNGVYVYSVKERNNLAMPEFDSYTIADTEPTFANVNTNTGNFTGTIPVDSLDEKVFTAKIKYSADSQQFHYATDDSSYGGFSLYPANGGSVLYLRKLAGSIPNFASANFVAEEIFGAGATFFDKEFVLQMTTEYVDADFDGNKDDVKLGVWFDGKLGNGQYYYYIDAVSALGSRITANEAGTPKLFSYYDELPAEINEFEEWTFSDVERADGTHPSGWAFTPVTGETLDKTVFHGYVTFTNSDQIFMFGSSKSYNGYGFYSTSDPTILNFRLLVGGSFTTVLTLNAADFGLSAFHNEKLELTVANRILKDNGSTYLIEVFPMINNKLPGGKSWTFEINKAYFTRSLGLANPMVVESIATSNAATIPADFTQLTLNDMAISSDKTNWQGTGYYANSWDETVISLDVNFGDSLARIRYGKDSGSYSGISIYHDGGKLYFGADYTPMSQYLTNVSITPAELGLESFQNVDLRIDFVTDYIDLDGDGSDDDLKVGCFINDVLVGGHYIYGYDCVDKLGQGFSVNNANIASISNVEFPARTIDETDYTFYTLNNVGIADGAGTAYGKLLDENNVKIEGFDYDGVMLGAKVKFTKDSARMHYLASDESGFSGVQIRLQPNGSLIVESYSGRLSYDTVTIDPAQFGFDTFANTAFVLKLTTDVINTNGDDEDDVRLGIWINGELANNSYIYILDQVYDLGCNINFNEDGGTTEHYSLWAIDAPADGKTFFYQIDSKHPYLVAADYIISSTGKRFENGEEVYTSGDYTAYFEATDDLQEAEHTVVLWREWDLAADGVLNVLDYISLIKSIAEIAPTTLAGQLAARELDTSNKLVELRKIILGITKLEEEQTYSLAKNDDDGAVMPIGAWVCPTVYPAMSSVGTDLAEFGIELNFLQDKYYEMITDLNINQLTYTGKDYNGTEKMSIIKGLSMAEKYGLTAYVDDSGIADNSASATDLAKRLNAYSRYSSFAGIHVTDEPHTNSFNSDAATKTVYEIAEKSVLLNRFTNLIGYSNLYGNYTLNNTSYKNYLAEVIDVLKPKLLSFDHYNGTTSSNGAISYFGSLSAIRDASLENNIPFVGFVSTGEDYTQLPVYTYDMEPTQGDINWNVNTMLAYGAKGYNWFTLIQPWYFALEGDEEIENMDFDRCGLIGANGEATRNYDAAKAINTFVGTIDHILMASTSVDVIATGSTAKYETGISKSTYGEMTVSAEYSEGAIVGVFDYNGKTAYYVVNYNTEASQDITLTFGSSQNMTIYTEDGSTTENASSTVLSLGEGAAALVVVD